MHKTRREAKEFFVDVIKSAKDEQERFGVIAELGKRDLFFLLTAILGRKDIDHDWLWARCMEVQQNPNGMMDLWAREHRKSTIITFGMSIQDILWDPEITIGIFAYNRPLAKDGLRQIKTEFEINVYLKQLYPHILYMDPHKESPKWNEDEGIVVKRKTNPREATVEAWGLVDGQPFGRHFNIRVYDDVVTDKHATTPEMIKKATEQWELSNNLGSDRICPRYGICDIERYIGTKYTINDSYKEILARKAAKPRIHPGTENGQPDGRPVYWSKELNEKKRRIMGPYIYSAQILQNPLADVAQGFIDDWLQYYTIRKDKIMSETNRYLLCDPACQKSKKSDYTVMMVIALGPDNNYYLVDGICDRLNLTERATHLLKLHRKWKPLKTGYEKYGKDSDIEHIEYQMDVENYRFPIIPLGGNSVKNDRIRKLIPLFEQSRFFLPRTIHFETYDKKQHNFVEDFVEEEYRQFPYSGAFDDRLDCMARILDPDLKASFPIGTDGKRSQGVQISNFEDQEYDGNSGTEYVEVYA